RTLSATRFWCTTGKRFIPFLSPRIWLATSSANFRRHACLGNTVRIRRRRPSKKEFSIAYFRLPIEKTRRGPFQIRNRHFAVSNRVVLDGCFGSASAGKQFFVRIQK